MSLLSDNTKKDTNRKLISSLTFKLATKQVTNVITLAGAGISTSAGICDLRSPTTGLYNKLRKFKLQFSDVMWDNAYFLNHPETLFQILKDNFLQNPLIPTVTHCFIKLLENKGVLLRHFTQNIDGMELMTGLAVDKVVEAHGSLQRSHCTCCSMSYNLQWLIKKVNETLVPYCDGCGGLVKPDIILFGEPLGQNFDFRSFVDLPKCDLLIVLGTSLEVEPFASMVNNVSKDCPILVISRYGFGDVPNNRDLKKNPNIYLLGDCDTLILELVSTLGWADDLKEVIRNVKLKKLYGDVLSVDVAVQTANNLTLNDTVTNNVILNKTNKHGQANSEPLRPFVKHAYKTIHPSNLSVQPDRKTPSHHMIQMKNMLESESWFCIKCYTSGD